MDWHTECSFNENQDYRLFLETTKLIIIIIIIIIIITITITTVVDLHFLDPAMKYEIEMGIRAYPKVNIKIALF